MADDELRRVPPDIAAKVGRKGNLGGNAGMFSSLYGMRAFFIFPKRVILILDLKICISLNKKMEGLI